jgi:Putative beta-barrel porin 2
MINSIRYQTREKTVVPYFCWALIGVFMGIACAGAAWGKGVILWDRLKLEGEIAAMESYNDNIYLSDTDEENDFITSFFPSLDLKFAFTPSTRLDVLYSGMFNYYKDAKNFRKGHHYGHARLQSETAKGSAFEFGAWAEDSAIQPYAIDDRSKDYYIHALYADVNLMVAAATELFGTYQHSIRRFDVDIDKDDNYDRDFFTIGAINSRSSLFPLLLEYRFDTQDNDDAFPTPTEFSYQSAFTGFRWGEDRRLSGYLKAGYLWSKFDGSEAYNGWATDTALDYEIGPFTMLTATAERGVRESTRSARDTLDYYIYAGAGLSLTYTRLDPFRLIFFGDYENRDYRSAEFTTDAREDDFYIAGITTRYRFRDWLSFSLGYRYRMNNSSIDTLDYTENRFFAEVILLSTGEIRARRLPRSYRPRKDF